MAHGHPGGRAGDSASAQRRDGAAWRGAGPCEGGPRRARRRLGQRLQPEAGRGSPRPARPGEATACSGTTQGRVAAAARGEVREQTWTTRVPPRSSGLVPPRAPAPVRTHKPEPRSHRPPRTPAPRGARAYPCLPRACSCVLREAKPGHACSRSRRRRLLFCLLLLASAASCL